MHGVPPLRARAHTQRPRGARCRCASGNGHAIRNGQRWMAARDDLLGRPGHFGRPAFLAPRLLGTCRRLRTTWLVAVDFDRDTWCVCVARDSMGYVRQRFWLISTSHRHGGKIGCTRGTMKNQRFQFAGSFNVYLWPVACTIRTRRAPRKPASVVASRARGARTRRLTGGGRRRSLAAIRRRMGASPRR